MPPGSGSESEADEIDLAVAAYREAGDWQVQDLPDDALDTLDDVARTLRRYPADHTLDGGGAIALISVEEDFFLLLRVRGAGYDVLLSDASAATDWALARSAVDHLGLPVEDDDEPAPAGDLAILADLGMTAVDMGLLLDDEDLYPDEQLSDIATRLGFGPAFDDLAGLTPA